jgi:molybdenum cofactor biosynthesis enzyme MoaA
VVEFDPRLEYCTHAVRGDPTRQRKPAPHFETGPRAIGAVRVLRISITDRCNFRCVYCMPEAGVPWLPKDDILSFDEIADVVRAAIEVHGIRRFKLTGGEPTVRHGLCDLVRILRRIEASKISRSPPTA